MNGRYVLAKTPEERIIIAIVSIQHEFFRLHPTGIMPDYAFLLEHLKPFIDVELVAAELKGVHVLQDHSLPGFERKLIERHKLLMQECSQRI